MEDAVQDSEKRLVGGGKLCRSPEILAYSTCVCASGRVSRAFCGFAKTPMGHPAHGSPWVGSSRVNNVPPMGTLLRMVDPCLTHGHAHEHANG